jgi:ADP-ribose pyrophosphatase
MVKSIPSRAPELIASQQIYRGKIFDLSIDTVREQGNMHEREVVHHPGSAAVVPMFPDGTIVLVKQYRHPTRKHLLEIPAGSLIVGERPEEAAARELEQETGFVTIKIEKLSEFFVTPGFCEEKMWVYLATDLTETRQQLEDDEIIEVVRIPFSQALGMITTGEIEDAKTIIGVMLAAPRVGPPMFETGYPAV